MLLIVAALAVGAYLLIKYYENQQSNIYGSTQGTSALGSNLNSIAPELTGGSTGPSVGPALSAPVSISINETSPVTPGKIGTPSANLPEQANYTPMAGVTTTGSSAMKRVNPVNKLTGIQARAPQSEDGGNVAARTAAGAKPHVVPAAAHHPAAHKPHPRPLKRPGVKHERGRPERRKA